MTKDFPFFDKEASFTDDSVMTKAITEALMQATADGVIDNEQFLIKINLSLLINRIEVDRAIILDDSLRAIDCACPIDLVESRVDILEDKGDKILVVFVKLDE